MSRIYSERLMRGSGAGAANWAWTVPEGYRCVVRHLSANAYQSAGAWIALSIGGIHFYRYDFQAASAGMTVQLRHTAYAGEPVGIYLEGANLRFQLDGFLFADTGGVTIGTDATVITGPPVEEM